MQGSLEKTEMFAHVTLRLLHEIHVSHHIRLCLKLGLKLAQFQILFEKSAHRLHGDVDRSGIQHAFAQSEVFDDAQRGALLRIDAQLVKGHSGYEDLGDLDFVRTMPNQRAWLWCRTLETTMFWTAGAPRERAKAPKVRNHVTAESLPSFLVTRTKAVVKRRLAFPCHNGSRLRFSGLWAPTKRSAPSHAERRLISLRARASPQTTLLKKLCSFASI